MSELTQTYLGNWLENVNLQQQVEQARATDSCLEVYLSQEDNLKSRIYTQSSSGTMVGIIKQRSWLLIEGDVFKTQQGKLAIIHLQAQQVMVLSFSTQLPGYEVALVHLGHILGNHHWSISIAQDKIYVQLAADRDVMETTIRNFNLPGLVIAYEAQAIAPLPTTPHSHASERQH